MNKEQELREAVEAARARLAALHAEAEGRSLTDEEQATWDTDKAVIVANERTLARYDEARELAAKPGFKERGTPHFQPSADRDDPMAVLGEYRSMAPREARRKLTDATLRANENKIEDGENQAHFERTLKQHASDLPWAAGILGRSSEVYAEAFSKGMTGMDKFWTNEERDAVQSGVDANGGYLLPTHLDPTIILTNSGTSNVIRGISRVVTLTEGDTWNGVTSAGVTAGWAAELAESTDNSPTFGRESIPVNRAHAFAHASIEAFQDISGLATDVLMLFADARDRLEGTAHATGSGASNQPTGIFTAIDAVAGSELDTATPQTLALADIHTVYRSVPVRWRGRGTWLMHPVFALAIKALGTAQSASFSGFLPAGTTDSILGRPVVESDDAPSTAMAVTTTENVLLYGDFSNYVIVDKPGSMAVEFIPNLFGTTANLPNGSRGWYAHWRSGADTVNAAAFRLLQDQG